MNPSSWIAWRKVFPLLVSCFEQETEAKEASREMREKLRQQRIDDTLAGIVERESVPADWIYGLFRFFRKLSPKKIRKMAKRAGRDLSPGCIFIALDRMMYFGLLQGSLRSGYSPA